MSEAQLPREVRRRLAIIRHAEEVTGNVALTCRYYGISRQCYYIWYRRYQTAGLEGLRDRSKRPLVSPRATHVEVVGKIIYLRQHYHFGPAKIAMYLKRYHEVQVSPSGVWRILKRLDLNRLPASQRHKRHDRRWKRYEKPLPGHRVQLDVKFIQRCPQRASRSTTSSPPSTTAPPAAGAADLPKAQPADRHPVRRLRAGAAAVPGGGHPDRQRRRVRLRLPLACAGQGRRPRLHQAPHPSAQRQGGTLPRIDAEAFYRLLDGIVIDDAKVFNDKLREWEDFYNYHRPHGGLDGQTPYERLKQRTQTRP
jgi:transposase